MKKCCYFIQGQKKPPIRYKWDTVSKRMVQIDCAPVGRNECCKEIDFDGGNSNNEYCNILNDDGTGNPADGGNS